MLAPNQPLDFEQTFAAHFQGMTAAPVTAATLLDVRERLLNRISEFLDATSRAFLESVEREVPDFDLIELPPPSYPACVESSPTWFNAQQRSAHRTTVD
jgi:hypothetical protein